MDGKRNALPGCPREARRASMARVPDVDELYALPLDDFVAARDRLARELREEGDRDGANTVKQLRKPSRVAWAVNQAVRAAPDLVDALIETGAALRAAQQHALDEGAPGALRDAVREQRDAVDALATVAVDALGSSGATARDRITETLRAGSLDPDAEVALRSGTLTAELTTPDVFGTLEPSARVAAARRAKASESETLLAESERDLERLRTRADELDREAKRAVDAAAEARHDAEEAARRVRELRRAR
jgi:hypothetical protein